METTTAIELEVNFFTHFFDDEEFNEEDVVVYQQQANTIRRP